MFYNSRIIELSYIHVFLHDFYYSKNRTDQYSTAKNEKSQKSCFATFVAYNVIGKLNAGQ